MATYRPIPERSWPRRTRRPECERAFVFHHKPDERCLPDDGRGESVIPHMTMQPDSASLHGRFLIIIVSLSLGRRVLRFAILSRVQSNIDDRRRAQEVQRIYQRPPSSTPHLLAKQCDVHLWNRALI